MENFLLMALASFAGTACALLGTYFLRDFVNWTPLPELSAEQKVRLQRAKLMSASVFAAIAALIVFLISAGELNAGLGGIAGVISLLVLTFGVRALRHA